MSGTIIDKLIVSLTMNAANYVAGSNQALAINKKLRDDAGSTASILEEKGKKLASFWTMQKLEALGVVAVLAAGAKALESITVKAATASAATGRLSQIENTTPERLSGLRAVAREYGSTADAATAAIHSIIGAERTYLKTGQSSPQMALMAQMGIHYVDPTTGKLMDPVEQIEQIAARLKKMPQQAAIATGEMLGWSDTFTNALIQSPGSLAHLIQSQVTTTKAQVAEAEKLVTAEGKLAAATERLDNDIMMYFAPLFIAVMNVSEDIANDLDKFLKTGGRPPGKQFYSGVLSAPGATEYQLTAAQIRAQEQVESGANQLDAKGQPVLSSAGAVGVMQLTPATAQETAARHGIPWDDHAFHYDRAYNERLGILRMQDLLARYHGNYAYALAAYNAGVAGASGYTSTGDLRRLPKETQDYLHRIAFIERVNSLAPPALPPGVLPQHVTQVLAALRVQQASGARTTTIHAPITINGAQSPQATAKAVTQSLNTLASQSARGLQ